MQKILRGSKELGTYKNTDHLRIDKRSGGRGSTNYIVSIYQNDENKISIISFGSASTAKKICTKISEFISLKVIEK